jgi:hypothetical protein
VVVHGDRGGEEHCEARQSPEQHLHAHTPQH